MRHILFTIHFSLLSILLGCGEKLPDGMPKLQPVTVTVTQEGKPLAGASVSLRYPDGAAGNWAIGGETDANGSAKLFTNGYAGAPLGKFKAVLFKEENEGVKERNEAKTAGDMAAARSIKVKVWSCVKEEYSNPAKTPLEVEITAETKTLTLDAGPAVKIDQPFVE